MSIDAEEYGLLMKLAADPDQTLRTRARPSNVVLGLVEKGAIVNVLTTTLSAPGTAGGTSLWKLTPHGEALLRKLRKNC